MPRRRKRKWSKKAKEIDHNAPQYDPKVCDIDMEAEKLTDVSEKQTDVFSGHDTSGKEVAFGRDHCGFGGENQGKVLRVYRRKRKKRGGQFRDESNLMTREDGVGVVDEGFSSKGDFDDNVDKCGVGQQVGGGGCMNVYVRKRRKKVRFAENLGVMDEVVLKTEQNGESGQENAKKDTGNSGFTWNSERVGRKRSGVRRKRKVMKVKVQAFVDEEVAVKKADPKGTAKQSLMCHQCQRNDRGRVVRCRRCKWKRCCIPCLNSWYVSVYFSSISFSFHSPCVSVNRL